MIQKEQNKSSRKLQMHMRHYLTQIKEVFMINMEKKVLKDKLLANKEVAVEVVALMQMKSSRHSSKEVVVHLVITANNKEANNSNTSSLILVVAKVVDNNSSSSLLKTYSRIQMLLD